MGQIEPQDEKILANQRELEKLEDDYHAKNLAISESFFILEDRRVEFERMLQDTYEATSHQLHQDDLVNEEAFMSMNQIIESFQIDFDTEYAKENRRLSDLEEETNQEYYQKRQNVERKIDLLMSERRENGNCW